MSKATLEDFRQMHTVGSCDFTQNRPIFADALAEIQSGQKRGHWIWYILPMVEGLGSSQMNFFFALNLAGAQDYLADAELCDHLFQIIEAAMQHDKSAEQIFSHDAWKFHSCLTLFLAASHANEDMEAQQLFSEGLHHFFNGNIHPATQAQLGINIPVLDRQPLIIEETEVPKEEKSLPPSYERVIEEPELFPNVPVEPPAQLNAQQMIQQACHFSRLERFWQNFYRFFTGKNMRKAFEEKASRRCELRLAGQGKAEATPLKCAKLWRWLMGFNKVDESLNSLLEKTLAGRTSPPQAFSSPPLQEKSGSETRFSVPNHSPAENFRREHRRKTT